MMEAAIIYNNLSSNVQRAQSVAPAKQATVSKHFHPTKSSHKQGCCHSACAASYMQPYARLWSWPTNFSQALVYSEVHISITVYGAAHLHSGNLLTLPVANPCLLKAGDLIDPSELTGPLNSARRTPNLSHQSLVKLVPHPMH